MSHHADREHPRLRIDDRPLWNIDLGMLAGPAVLVAYELKLFPLLAEHPCTLSQICAALNIAPRAAQALLSVCTAWELVRASDGLYALTPTSEAYPPSDN
jgi:hypothetical protein